MSELYQIPGLFITASCHVVVIYHMLEHRYAKGKFVLLSCLYIVSFACMGGYAYVVRGKKALLAYLLIAVCLFLFFCIVSKDCFSKKCFLFLTYFGLYSIIDNSLRLIVELFLPQMSAPVGHYLVNVLRTASLLLILALYKRYAVSVVQSLADINKGRWWNLALIALLFYLLQASINILNALHAVQQVYLILSFAAISLVMCAVYGAVFSNISYMKKDSEAALVRQNAEYLFNQLSAMQKAEEAGIDYLVHCNVPKELKVREIDLIALLGNLLENALHGCQESGKENKSIVVHIRLQNNKLIILCNNTCLDGLKISGGLPVEKGIGISSLLSVCRKYDGNLDYKIENENCSVCAILNL